MKQAVNWSVLAAVSYVVAGKLGLMLAIPLGFASAVWPASGVALALMLVGRPWAVAIGTLVGSFVINLSLTSNHYSLINVTTVLPAAGIAVGALAQAFFGKWLYLRIMADAEIMESPAHILRFIFFIAIIGCLVAPSVGVGILYVTNVISAQNGLFSWVTWWMGDAIGVMLFTPLVLTLFARSLQLSLSRKLQTIIPTLVIFSGVLVLFVMSTSKQHQQMEADIEESAQRVFDTLGRNIETSLDIMAAYAGLFNASDYVSFADFSQFSVTVANQNKVFDAIGWTEVVADDERDNQGQWRSAPVQSEYFPVVYIHPLAGNEAAIGFNLGSEPIRRSTMLRAREKLRPQMTSPIQIVQDQSAGLSAIVYYPVYKSPPGQSFNINSAVFQGFVSGVVRLPRLVNNVLQKARAQHFDISLSDVTNPENIVNIVTAEMPALNGVTRHARRFDFAGREFELQYFATNQFQLHSKDWASFTILTAGFLFAATIQAFILMLTGRTESVKREVQRKTQELEQAKLAAERASRAKSEFTANMSHELRTPLNAVLGLLRQCQKTALAPKQREYLQRAQLAAETLTALINSALDFAKIEAGKMELEQAPFNFSHILRKIHAIFADQAQRQGLVFALQLPESLPNELQGDALRLEQVLLNLLSNAFKFTQIGSVTLTVAIDCHDSTSCTLGFSVRDSGIGIAEEKQGQIFESFRQADSSTSRHFGGTGLGLTISQQLVTMMGGRITVVSALGKGCEFRFSLPFLLASEQVVPATSVLQPQVEAMPLKQQANSSLIGKRVLVVEDVAINRLIVQELLTEYRVEILMAENGEQALSILAASPAIDLILMDIQMPKMDGYEATRRLRSDPKTAHLPVIAMTANAMNEDVEACLQAGMDGHIAKPIDEAILVATLCHWLGD